MLARPTLILLFGATLVMATLAPAAVAADTGNQMPAKDAAPATPPAADPNVIRQGGDTIADAVVIPSLPYETTGTTAGYTDDHDEACPYPGSTSPDVVYAYTPDADLMADIDMLGSTYDTKIYVYDADLALDAYNGGCNSPEFGNLFQHLHGDANGELILCGTTGWYQFQGSNYRDTDWFVLHAGDAGGIEVTGDAERPT